MVGYHRIIIDGRNIDQELLEADICVVGGGAAGITVANKLIESSLSVILLESGDVEFDQVTQSLYEGENRSFNDFDLAFARLRFFGGTTNH